SQESQRWYFKVNDVPVISWRDNKSEGASLYIDKPWMVLSWKPIARAVNYRLFVKKAQEDAKEISFDGATTKRKISVPGDGVYEVRVVGYEKDEKPLARSKVRKEMVSFKPLLPAPRFEDRAPASLSASRS